MDSQTIERVFRIHKLIESKHTSIRNLDNFTRRLISQITSQHVCPSSNISHEAYTKEELQAGLQLLADSICAATIQQPTQQAPVPSGPTHKEMQEMVTYAVKQAIPEVKSAVRAAIEQMLPQIKGIVEAIIEKLAERLENYTIRVCLIPALTRWWTPTTWPDDPKRQKKQ